MVNNIIRTHMDKFHVDHDAQVTIRFMQASKSTMPCFMGTMLSYAGSSLIAWTSGGLSLFLTTQAQNNASFKQLSKEFVKNYVFWIEELKTTNSLFEVTWCSQEIFKSYVTKFEAALLMVT